jgi:catechol 2,3-dioxygenase-like lactoylglutathione lyase family enzyme
MPISISALDHVVLNVVDVETSANWYERVLGMKRKDFEPAPGKQRRTSMLFGNYKLNFRPVAVGEPAAAFMTDELCFLTETTPEDVVRHLQHCGIPIAEGPVAKHGAVGILISVYCRDPDGRLIEIAAYED